MIFNISKEDSKVEKSFLENILNSNELEFLFSRFLILIFLFFSIVTISYFLFIKSGVESVFAGVEKIKKDEILISGLGKKENACNIENFLMSGSTLKGYNCQISFLNEVFKKEEFDLKQNEAILISKIDDIIYNELNYDFLAKYFEDLFLAISSKESPVVLNSITLGQPIKENMKVGEKALDYERYPVNISFSSDDSKFEKILEIVNLSGSLDEKNFFKGKSIPLMTLNSVNLNFSDKQSEKTLMKGRTVQLFMYTLKASEKIKN